MNQCDQTSEVELLRDIVRTVKSMREAQRAWFGGDKSSVRLTQARTLERRVDALIRQTDL